MLDGDFFESLSDISFGDMYTRQVDPNIDVIEKVYNSIGRTPILFIETSRIIRLLNIVRSLNFDVIIICHNSDVTLNDNNLKSHIPSNVIRLWCQNYNGPSDDIIRPLPIGLERRQWFPEQNKQKVLLDIKKDGVRDDKCYMNFNISTNPVRLQWRDHLINKEFIYSEMLGNGNDYNLYCEKMTQYKFTISPPGNGIDCHRNWESLYLNCVPIIQRSNFTENIFGDMNVILVDSYLDITKELLDNYESKFNVEKLSTEYWEDIIKKDIKKI